MGRARARGRRCLGPAGRRGPRVARHRHHQPRDLRHAPRACRSPGRWSPSAARAPRSTSSSRPATWSDRSRRSGRRTSSTGAPRPTAASSRTCRTPSAAPRSRSGSGGSRRSPTCSTAGARPSRASASTWSPSRRPARARHCCGSASPACSASTRPSSPPPSESNASLGVPESAMIRRLNMRLNDSLPNHHYRPFVREMVVHRNLSRRPGSQRLSLARGRLPLGQRPRPVVGQRARAARVRRRRHLDDLVPGDPAAVRRPRPRSTRTRWPRPPSTRWRS